MESASVLCHLFYKDSLEILKPYLNNLPAGVRYYFNICSDVDYADTIISNIKACYENAVITCSPNVGKDIGGKLVLLDTYIKLKKYTDYLILLHDKVSPHTSMGDIWRKKLLSIIEKENLESILNKFRSNEKTGLIASKSLIKNEYDNLQKAYTCTSNQQLQALRSQFAFKSNTHDFVGGTMFWIRSAIYEQFFAQHHPLVIRKTLEAGNVLDNDKGTFTHAWERMLSWIVIEQGYTLKGI